MRDRSPFIRIERKPVVIILAVQPAPEATIAPILWGLEEEGVPAELYEVASGEAEALAKEAATRSPLNVGIGINLDNLTIALHHRNLPLERPLFILRSADLKPSHLQVLGTNAARLVKGDPLVIQDVQDETSR
jgi:hypothetical protein